MFGSWFSFEPAFAGSRFQVGFRVGSGRLQGASSVQLCMAWLVSFNSSSGMPYHEAFEKASLDNTPKHPPLPKPLKQLVTEDIQW